MKKILPVVLALIMAVVATLPAQAAGITHGTASLAVDAPSQVTAGDTAVISLTTSSDKPSKFVWRLVLPKTTLESVTVIGNLVPVEDPNNWIFVWKGFLKRDQAQSVSLQVSFFTDRGGRGLPLLRVRSGGVLVAEYFVDVIKPSIQWTVMSPDAAIYGGRPIQLRITAGNTFGVTLPFDVRIEVLHSATNREMHSILTGGNLSSTKGDNSTVFVWQGTVAPDSSLQLYIGTGTGINLGTQDLMYVTDILSGAEIARKSITLVQGTGIPYGEFGFRPSTGSDIKIGGAIVFDVWMYAPTLGQFVLKGMKSDNCTLVGLPAGFYSRPDLTYVNAKFTLTLASAAGPTCSVTGYFAMSYDLTKTYPIVGEFLVAP